jgi:hypothetical protein
MKNEFEIRGDITAIYIKQKDGTIFETKISTSDLSKAQEFPSLWHVAWSKDTNSYYVNGRLLKNEGSKSVKLHRWILECPKGLVVDHINHDTLDNTRENLRILARAQNQQNRKGAMKNNKTSGIRGVSWSKNRNKWQAYVSINAKLKFLGYFEDIKEAEKTAINARKKYMPYSVEDKHA